MNAAISHHTATVNVLRMHYVEAGGHPSSCSMAFRRRGTHGVIRFLYWLSTTA